jgi:hypothetical protein
VASHRLLDGITGRLASEVLDDPVPMMREVRMELDEAVVGGAVVAGEVGPLRQLLPVDLALPRLVAMTRSRSTRVCPNTRLAAAALAVRIVSTSNADARRAVPVISRSVVSSPGPGTRWASSSRIRSVEGSAGSFIDARPPLRPRRP